MSPNELHRTADDCWRAHIRDKESAKRAAETEYDDARKAYAAWQAQQKGGWE